MRPASRNCPSWPARPTTRFHWRLRWPGTLPGSHTMLATANPPDWQPNSPDWSNPSVTRCSRSHCWAKRPSPCSRTAELGEALRLAERVIDLPMVIPTWATSSSNRRWRSVYDPRGSCECAWERAGGGDDLEQAAAMCREFLPVGRAVMLIWKYAIGVVAGAVLPDAAALRETAEIFELAEQQSEDSGAGSRAFPTRLGSRKTGRAGSGAGWHLSPRPVKPPSSTTPSPCSCGWSTSKSAGRRRAPVISTAPSSYSRRSLKTSSLPTDSVLRNRSGCSGRVTPCARRKRRHRAAQAEVERLAALPTDAGFVWYEISCCDCGHCSHGPRRRSRVSALGGPLSRQGARARLPRTYRRGRGDDVATLAIV